MYNVLLTKVLDCRIFLQQAADPYGLWGTNALSNGSGHYRWGCCFNFSSQSAFTWRLPPRLAPHPAIRFGSKAAKSTHKPSLVCSHFPVWGLSVDSLQTHWCAVFWCQGARGRVSRQTVILFPAPSLVSNVKLHCFPSVAFQSPFGTLWSTRPRGPWPISGCRKVLGFLL